MDLAPSRTSSGDESTYDAFLARLPCLNPRASERLPRVIASARRRKAVSFRSRLLGVPDSPQRFCSPQKPFKNREWIGPACGGKPAELDEVNSSLPVFDLRHPTMGDAKPRGQIALRDSRVCSNGAEFYTKNTVIRGMHRFFHCSHYRNMVECSQNRHTIEMRPCVLRGSLTPRVGHCDCAAYSPCTLLDRVAP